MKIKFFKKAELEKNLKVTIHKTGKAGFTFDAAKKLQLSIDKSAGIGINEDDETDKNLYMVIYPTASEGDFKVSKAGEYFYLNTKVLFDNLKIDYIKENVVYDMSEHEHEGQTFYKLKRREKAKVKDDQE